MKKSARKAGASKIVWKMLIVESFSTSLKIVVTKPEKACIIENGVSPTGETPIIVPLSSLIECGIPQIVSDETQS